MKSKRKRMLTGIILAVVLVALAGCAQNGSPQVPLADQTLHFTVNGENLEMPLSKDGAVFDAVTMNCEFPNEFQLINQGNGVKVSINGEELKKDGTAAVEIPKLSFNTMVDITASDGTDERTVHLRTVSSKVPALITAGKSPYEGAYYISFVNTPTIVKLDEAGNLLYYRCEDNGTNAAPQEDPTKVEGLWDFKKHTVGDQVYYSYWDQDNSYNKMLMPGYGGGARVLMDDHYQVIDRIYMKGTDLAAEGDPVEGHDFCLIDKDHYIVSNYMLELVNDIPAELNPNPQGSKVAAAYLQEVKDGKVVFEWKSTDHPELYALSGNVQTATANDFANAKTATPDYIHFNSIDIDPSDDNLVVSFRHFDTIAKIDRKSGDILWKLSGKQDEFGLTEEQKTSGQHYARFTDDGFLTVFDNGNAAKASRVVKYKLDQENKKLLDFQEFKVGNHFSSACGSATQVDGAKNVFTIGWGAAANERPETIMTEMDFSTNQKLLEVSLFDQTKYVYRCVKCK